MVIRDKDGVKHFPEPIPAPFRPYFYIEPKDLKIVNMELERLVGKGLYNFILTDLDFALAEGKAIKCELWEPWRVGNLKRHFMKNHDIKLHEADIPYIRRIKIDLGIKSGIQLDTIEKTIKPYSGDIPPAKKLYIDIEVDDSEGFPETPGEYKILCIGTTTESGFERYFTWEYGKSTEAQMLSDFYDYAKDFGYLVVWNKDFESKHIPKRCRNLDLWREWRVFQWIDLAEYWRMFNQKTYYEKLDVAYKEVLKKYGKKLDKLGIIKHDVLERLVGYYNVWKNDSKKLKEVNSSHAYALYVIEMAIEVINLYDGVSDEVGIFLKYAHWKSHIVDTLAMRFNNQALKKWVIPSTGKYDKSKKGFRGAVVFPAKSGVHSFIFLFDFTSLYNKVIQSYLLDPIAYYYWNGTFTEDGINKYIEFADMFGKVYGVEVDFEKGEGENKVIVKKRLPIFPAILHTMEGRRNKLKGKRQDRAKELSEQKLPYKEDSIYQMYDQLQKAAKVVLLACYGVLGMSSSRWTVTKEIPENMIQTDPEKQDFRVLNKALEKFVGMVTYIARQALEKSKDFFNADESVDVTYGDTDSDFVNPVDIIDEKKTYKDLTEKDLEILYNFGIEFGEKLERFFSENFQEGIEMKLEKIFDRGVFGKKKKQYYCRTIWDEDSGWQYDKDGNLTWYVYTKGLPLVRSDRTPFLKRTQPDTLKTMLDDPKLLKNYWIKTADEYYNNIYDYELILRVSVKRKLSTYKIETPQIRAAKKILERGGKFRPGEKVAFIIVDVTKGKPVVEPVNDNLPPKEAIKGLPKISKKALEYYWTHRIWKNIEPFLELVLTDREILEIKNAQQGISLIDKWF